MDNEKISQSIVSNTSCGNPNSENSFRTIPIPGNLQESIHLMTHEQIALNLIQINLVSLYNEEILNKLCEWSVDTEFYLRNRHILENLINVHTKNMPKNHPANKYKKSIKEISEKYDAMYVNGNGKKMEKQSQILKEGFKKEHRAQFICDRQDFAGALEQLSFTLKENEQKMDEEEMVKYFQSQLHKLNMGKQMNCQNMSPNKVQLIKSSSSVSVSSNESSDDFLQSSTKSQKLEFASIFTISYQQKIRKISEINIENSKFIRTKNRYPLVLDFGFSKFLYKNDDQLAHELIAMGIIRYLNKLISIETHCPQIVEYEIIPEAFGAFYEFVDNSMTISNIKRKYKGGILEYLNELESQNMEDSKTKISKIRKRFAQTYAGFCIAQYFLQLKDRNNDNIMIRKDGSIFHIDLAFIFNATPGGLGFESCPFKFTKQYLEAMGGFESDTFKYFQTLLTSNLTKLCINKSEFFSKMSILTVRNEIPCFRKFNFEVYKKKIPSKPAHVKEKVEELISDSFDNWRTNKYDNYQFKTNKIPC